jgi:hypothetical protein
MAFDGSGNPIAAAGTSANLTPVSTFINTLLDDANAADARTTLGAASASELDADELILDSVKQAVRNPVINGNLEVWQRGTAFAAVADNTYTADRWKWRQSGAGVVTINRSTNVPTVAQAGVKFNYSIEVDVTTADATLAAGDLYELSTIIEGYNWRHFAERQFTISFWAMATKTGQHTVNFRNSVDDRSYQGLYTINSSDAWEYKTVTVTAPTSAGTWNYTNGIGLVVNFPLAAGSTYEDTSGAWHTGNYHRSFGSVNDMDSTANFFRVTGVKIELGSIATPIQFVPFEEELQRCQRYYQKTFRYATAPAQSVGLGAGTVQFTAGLTGAAQFIRHQPFQVPMRSATDITVTTYNPSAANAQVRNVTDAADCTGTSTSNISEFGFTFFATGNAGLALTDQLEVHWAAQCEL